MDYPLINGVRHSFASVEASINGKRYLGFASINYSDSVEPTAVRGTHSQALGHTRGDYDSACDFEMALEEAEEMMADLGDGIYDARLDLTVVFADDNAPTITHKIVGCRFTEIGNDNSSGSEGSTTSFTVQPIYIERNGRKPFRNMLSN